MELSEERRIAILAEVIRLVRSMRQETTPREGIVLVSILVESLVAIIAGKLSVEDFLEVTKESRPIIAEYYVEFFKVYK